MSRHILRRLAGLSGVAILLSTILLGAPSAYADVATGSLPLTAPMAPILSATATSVQVSWVDNLTNETGFQVLRVNGSGSTVVATVATRSGPLAGVDVFNWSDTDIGSYGQCYAIWAIGEAHSRGSAVRCTVRPDSTRFPQTIPAGAVQWTGLSSNVGVVGNLFNTNSHGNGYLAYSHRTLGVDLDWNDSSQVSQFTVERAGDLAGFDWYLMKGEPVAIHIPGEGYLTTGDPLFGINLDVHRSTPSYEWYVLGGSGPGDPLNAGTFALWNSRQKDYLVYTNLLSNGLGTIDLFWYKEISQTMPPGTATGVNTYRLYNCSLAQHAVQVWIKDLTNGTPFAHMGALDPQYGPNGCPDASTASGSVPFTYPTVANGHHYQVVATDKQAVTCNGFDDPNISGCRAMTADFVGDLSYYPSTRMWAGVIRTDVVNGSTRVDPCTVDICGLAPSSPTLAPDFAVELDKQSGTLVTGAGETLHVTLTALNGYAETPQLTVSGLPTGVVASFSPSWVSVDNSTSTLTLTAKDDAPAYGTYPITISTDSRLTGAGKSATFQLSINGEGPPPDPSS